MVCATKGSVCGADKKMDGESKGSTVGASRREAVGAWWGACEWTTNGGATTPQPGTEEGRAKGAAKGTDMGGVDGTFKDRRDGRVVVT